MIEFVDPSAREGESKISFTSLDVEVPQGFDRASVSAWLQEVAAAEGFQLDQLAFYFCSDAHLLQLNQQYLQHDTLTDILTFPYGTQPIQADIYISVDRILENASQFSPEQPLRELYRVIVHGLLHMCGHTDENEQAKALMRDLESHYIAMLRVSQ